MSLASIFLIAVGLAMDAFAVSIASGLAIKNLRLRHALLIATFFGAFQGIMPLIGWVAGFSFRDYIAAVDHWIAFVLLSIIGIKMIAEAFKLEESENQRDPLNVHVLFILAIATSIDALAVGLSFACLNVTIIGPALIISIVTFCLSILGVMIGEKFGHLFEKRIEVLGGIILIGIGLKILIEHLFLGAGV